MSRYPGALFCTDHLASVEGQKRISCPIDPRHSIYEADLEKHIKFKCPGLKSIGSEHPWFLKDVNSGDPVSQDEEEDAEPPLAVRIAQSSAPEAATSAKSEFVSVPEFQLRRHRFRKSVISTTSPEVISALIKRLEGLWTVYEPEISSELILAPISIAEDSVSPTRIKHATQNEAIVSHLKLAGMWDSQNLYIEWGAGNALLSHHIQQLLHTDHIIVDRKVPKSKSDSKRDRERIWKRLTIDIKDLVLNLVPEVSDPSKQYRNICSFSKHLCGAATDLTIRCVQQHMGNAQREDSVLIALCCHHRCSWQTYIGRTFFEDSLGLTREDFELMVRMSSWATSGEHQMGSEAVEGEEIDSKNTNEDQENPSTLENAMEGQKTGSENGASNDLSDAPLTLEEKTLWGWRCKRLLDVGRAHYMRQIGFETKFRYYVPPSVSLENIVMVCRKNNVE
jgi:tRNA:m4X modification enzyme